eukprot:g18441.t1
MEKYFAVKYRPIGPKGWEEKHRKNAEFACEFRKILFLRAWDEQHNLPPPPLCMDSSRAAMATEATARFTKHVSARIVMALESEEVQRIFEEACQAPARDDLDANNHGMDSFYQALNSLIADTKFQPQVIVPEENTDRIQAGESPDDIRVFPTESLLSMKLTELNPSDMSTIPPRDAEHSNQRKLRFPGDTFSQSLLTVVPEVYDQLINPSAAGPTALPANKKSSKGKNTDILIHDLLVKHSMKMDGQALQDNYSTAQKNLISIDNMLSNEQDPTKRRRLLKQKEYWELEMDEAFEDIKKEKKKKKKKIAVDPSSRAQKRVRSLQESDSDADQVSNSKAEVEKEE